MLSKIGQTIEKSGTNIIIEKTFIRNLKIITSRSAYSNNKLYFRSWRIDAHDRSTKLFQSYDGQKPIPNTQGKLDYIV